jgi:hypothetical protein
MSRDRQRLPLRVWCVTVPAHQVDRWNIPAARIKVPAVSAESACHRVVCWLQSDAGCPPLKPIRRRSLKHATATEAS